MTTQSHRILCIGETWLGSDARAAFMAFRRLGHSVQIVDESHYVPIQWRLKPSKIVRRVLKPLWVSELSRATLSLVERVQPSCLFVFKGSFVHPELIQGCRRRGVPAVNYYPDVSFLTHGAYIPRALPLYDHVFTTKSYGLRDMEERLGVKSASFLEPGYDPDLHRPLQLSVAERELYECDAVFIGTWSPKKEAILSSLRHALPSVRLKVWGSQWDKSGSAALRDCVEGDEVTGDEYTKAICGASICLGLLSEVRTGASSGDLITARTFQIPACGTFMLHERNPEVLGYFQEGRDAAFFDVDSPDEVAEKVGYYLAHQEERSQIARNGLQRSLQDEYSIDGRMKVVLRWLDAKLGSKPGTAPL